MALTRIYLLIGLTFAAVHIRGEDNCTFSQLILRCITQPDDLVGLTVYALVNSCNNPVDVTFGLRDLNTSWSWEHTFVNADETQPLTGLAEDTHLHVALETINHNELFVQANLVINGFLVTPFIDEEVILPQCQESDNANEYLPLIIFIILLVLILVLVGMAISFMREKHRKTAQLLSNMEGPLGTAPYQEEPINTDYSDDPNHVTTTVIKNDIYRDSINLEDTQVLGDVLPSNGEDGRIPIYNPRSKKNCKNRTDRKNTKRDEEVILRVHNINPTPLYSCEHDRY